MDFEHFAGLCGSLFAEEFKGDFDAAWEYLQVAKPGALDATADLTHRAEYLRCAAIFAILTGDFADAYVNLESLHELLEQLPPEWGLRYTNYKILADTTRRFPPTIRFYHERGRPLNAQSIGDVKGPDEMQSLFMANVQKYFPQGVIRDQMLCQIMLGIQGYPVTSRMMNAFFHPLFPGGSQHKPDVDPGPTISEVSKFMAKLRDTAEANGALSIAGYQTRLIAELHVSSNSSQTTHSLSELFQKYESFNDYAGMANAKMIDGDRLLCQPFANPLSLNLIVVDNADVLGDGILWDSIQNGLEFNYTPEIQRCYESALDLFQHGNCKRGQAALLLRQAGCLHIMARLNRSTDKQYLQTLGEAQAKLREALALFGKDQASVQIVKVHQILINISRGSSQGIKAYAQQIGEWCVAKKNEILGHFLGLLLSRYAHQEWNRFSNMDAAVMAWECAFELLSPIKDMVPIFQCVVARAKVQHDMFNLPASQLLIEEALDMVDEVRDNLDAQIQSTPETPTGQAERITLIINKCTLLWEFGRRVTHVFLRAENVDRFQEWQAKQAELLETDDFNTYRDRLEGDDSAEYSDTFHPQSINTFKPRLPILLHKTKGLYRKVAADDAVQVIYGSASIKFRRFLFESTDILKAEESLRQFVHDAEKFEKVYTRDLYRIIACDRIGDRDQAQRLLDSITDEDLFHGYLNDYQNGIGLHVTFPLVAHNALTFTVLAGDMARGRRLVGIILKISPTFFASMIDNEMDYAERLGNYATIMMDHEPEICFLKLLQALEIIETRRRQTTDLDAQTTSSDTGWNGEVYLNLARLSLACKNSGIPIQVMSKYNHGHFDGMSWAEHALLFVEMSRARAVLESLQSQATQASGSPDIPQTASEAVHKRRLLRSLLSLNSLTEDQEKEVTELRDYLQMVEGNEALSSATTFIETVNTTIDPKFLYQSIDENAVVIDATFGPRGFIAFAVTRDGIQQTRQSTTRAVDIRRPVMQAMKILENMNGFLGGEDEGAKRRLEELSRKISEELILPFAEIIKLKSHVIFSISNPLTAFPFSILPFENKPLITHAAVSQVPSLTVLYYLSHRKSPSERPTVSVLAKSPKEANGSNTREANGADLHMAGIEAVNIARTFATWPIEASHLTRTDFQQYIQGGSLIMHIGTHGNINYRNPLLSSISIGQGQEFRVVDMSAIRSSVHLLVFAACLSGLGKATIGSEVLGFSHIVLSSGCQAFIGSLWEVRDFGSMLIMTLFYRHLSRHPNLAVAELMRMAQVDVLQLDAEGAGTFLDELLDDWRSTGVSGQIPTQFVPDAEFLLLRLRMLVDQLDWSSPFYWAPFTLIGYGGFRFVH